MILDAYRTCEGDSVWEVQDLGDGIPSQKLAELGQVTVDGARGVARVWSIIERHRGLLRFESEVGVGTTATIWLPAVAGLGFD